MKGYKKSILSLAITGVLSGMVAAPVFANENIVINEGETKSGYPTALEITQAGSVSNNGTISSRLYAVVLDAVATLDLTNSGTIIGFINPDNPSAVINLTNSGNINRSGNEYSIAGLGKVNITNSGSIYAMSIKSGTLTNTSGSITTTNAISTSGALMNGTTEISSASITSAASIYTDEDLTNYGIINVNNEIGNAYSTLSVGRLLTNNGTISVAGDIDSRGAIINSGTISTDYIVKAAAVTNTGSFVSGGSIDSHGDITNGSDSNDSAIMFVKGDLITNNNLTNYGTITVDHGIAGAGFGTNVRVGRDLTNHGTMTVKGLMDSTLDVVNKGTLSIEEGSTAANFDGSGGQLILTSRSKVNSIYTLLDAGTNATVDASTSITVVASDRTLSQPGTQNDVVLIKSTNLTSNGFEAGNRISSGSILLRLSNAEISGNNIIADIEVLSAGNILNLPATSVDLANLADDFQDMDTDGQQIIESVYGSLIDNSASSAEMSEYLDEIRPDDSGSAAIAASDVTTAAMGNIMNRSANLRGVNFGDMQVAGGVWLQALYGKAGQDAKDGNLGYDSDLSGFTLGLDSERGNQTQGIAFSYGKSDIKFSSRSQKDEVESYIGTFYNFWRMDKMYVDTSFSLGGSTHKGSRLGGAANMTSDYGSTQMGAQALVGFYMPQGDLMVEPMASLRLNLVNVEGYTASNSEGDLTEVVDDVSYRRFDAGLGVAVSKRWEIGQGTMTPRASLMAYRDFIGDTMDNQVTFAGNDYVIEGASAEKTSYEMRLGMDMTRGENTTFTVGYTRVQKSDFSSDNFDFRVRYDF